MTTIRTVGAALLAFVIAGCSVSIRTEERAADGCLAHPVRGTLIADREHGLGLLRDGIPMGVIWPFGYAARWQPDGIVLLDPGGNVVAREGDELASAGMGEELDDGLAHPCGQIVVLPRTGG